MRRCLFVALVIFLGLHLCGCGEKEKPEEPQMSMATLTDMGALTTTQEAQVTVAEPIVVTANTAVTTTSIPPAVLEPLPPAGPYKPAAVDIQTALSNAGFYKGLIDGKIGPQSKKAITEFQKANGLEADGKVGPRTWVVLGKYLRTVKPASGISAEKSR